MRRIALFFTVFIATSLAAQYSETIDVVRYLVPARVVNPRGDAITDLTAADFTATIGGKKATVESVDWLGSGGDDDRSAPPETAGRLIVVFMQTDFARAPGRVVGQMAFNALATTILEMVAPEDHVAVASHDSHLKLQCDFTLDRDRARTAIHKAIEIRRVDLPPPPETGPSLARHLDLSEMRDASSAGEALHLIAKALQAHQGEKVVLLGGWGIGELLNRRVLLDRAWRDAMHRFRDQRTPVITLNTGRGGQLTAGLVASSNETGGIYAGSAQSFPQQSMTRLRGALAGYYELVLRLEKPLPPGEYRVELRTALANANVVAAPLTVVRVSESGVNEIVDIVDPAPPAVSATQLYLDALRNLRDGNAPDADALLTRAIDLGDAPAESWLERALLRAARGEMEAATEDLRAYLERAPTGKRSAEARDLLRSWQ